MTIDEEFCEWELSVPKDFSLDPMWTSTAYRLATFLSDRVWSDIELLSRDARTLDVGKQLYRAIGSIGANYTEAYSRRSVADRCRFYEYALGSAREARHWTYKARHVIGQQRHEDTLRVLTRIIQLLTATIVNERSRGRGTLTRGRL